MPMALIPHHTFTLLLQAYFILDEFLLAGEIQDSSKKSILSAIRLQDFIQEEETPQGLFEDAGLGWDDKARWIIQQSLTIYRINFS